MNDVAEASAALAAACNRVDGLREYTLGASIDPPAFVVGPPALTWESPSVDPTSARFLVYVMVPADERALPRLWGFVEQIVAVIDAVTNAVVVRADPGRFAAGITDLPSYEITVEMSL
jgi:hypothetical protein